MRRWVGLGMLLTLAACATPQTSAPDVTETALAEEALKQQRFVIEEWVGEMRRVDRIHTRLSEANLEFCEVRSKSVGMNLHNVARYPKTLREAARAIGLTNAPTVAYVLEGSPAERAGIKAGDVILIADGDRYYSESSSVRDLDWFITDWPGGPLPMTLKRGEEKIEVSVTPNESCGYPLYLTLGDEVNASADGERIELPFGMLRFVQSDDELALIIGHELAHNAMRHRDSKTQNEMLGTAAGAVLDVVVAATTGYSSNAFAQVGSELGAEAYSPEFETEADYVGMYFAARAGFDIEGVEVVWRRMSTTDPQGITLTTTHPANAHRFLALAATREEIRAKQKAGAPLIPNLKKKSD